MPTSRRGRKNVALIYRPFKPEAFQLATDVARWLKARKAICWSPSNIKLVPGTRRLASSKQILDLDFVVVLGGDGTFLRAARLLEGHKSPILGVNLGSLGFLTETRSEDLFGYLEKALAGDLKTKSRMMLEVSYKGPRGRKLTNYALNDVVIERGTNSRLINIGIHSEGESIYELTADGIIVATPTGSTAYNLASGGPIIHPDVSAMTITPICAHSLTDRPITLPDTNPIRLQLSMQSQKAFMLVDGVRKTELKPGDEVEVRRSSKEVSMFVIPSSPYFQLLRNKLHFGRRS
jgi:NAD+ kinase